MKKFKGLTLMLLSGLLLAACASEDEAGQRQSGTETTSEAVTSSYETVDGGTRTEEVEEKLDFSEEDIAALTAEAIEGVEDRYDIIQERGTIRFGYTGGFAPYNFKDPETGEYSGFETDIAYLIAEDLGVEAEFVEMSFQSLVAATDLPVDHPESIDVALNNHGRTPERAAEHDFTLPYLNSVFGVWVKEDSDLQTIADLDGKVAAQSPTGSTGDAALLVGASELLPVTTSTDGRKMVEQGRADFHVMDYNATIWAVKNGQDQGLRVLDETIDRPDPVGMVISPGSPKLLEALNASIEKHTKNGNYKEIYEKYLGEDISVNPILFDAFRDQVGQD